ncbi:MAG: DUF465 domain-containing protein [Acidobacteriota bacterium]|jgi:uncharacterized protein YdcH (DUF465 family)|nr:DUF465 domain-containing protein [Acidobacteriota bacterium]
MSISDAEFRERLMQEDAEFRKLATEHHDCDQQLNELKNRHFQTEEDQLAEKKLKKKKLALKDQMYAIMQKYSKHS